VDHEAGVVICREKGDVYNTNQPSAAFHARTTFCLDVHNEVTRANMFRLSAVVIVPLTLHCVCIYLPDHVDHDFTWCVSCFSVLGAVQSHVA
jgi:hypothetical protein